MQTSRLITLVQSTAHHVWRLPIARFCFATCVAITVCGTGSLEAQQTPSKKLTSPGFNSSQALYAKPKAAKAPAQFPLAATFTLHSRPTATKVIYLDFDGHSTTGTFWNSGGNTIVTAAYDTDSDPSTFSASEQADIQEIWERVAECFSPFDVDVTTEAPTVADLINSGGGDTRWGMRVLIGVSTPDPAPSAGGVAYLTSFSWNTDTPCFVFPQRLGPYYNKAVADASIHEVGHTVGLNHDGTSSLGYYGGHGPNYPNPIGWAPHMGVGYSKSLVQWSKGEYLDANNQEDDLNIITTQNGFGYRPDDAANSSSGAKAIAGTPGAKQFTIDQSGVIERRTDSDWFKITCGPGTIKLNAVGGPVNTMLDIQMDLYNSKGGLIIADNPPSNVTASISQSVPSGTYYVKIDGVGMGDPLATGYTDYGSLGQYRITGSFSVTNILGAPKLAMKSDLFYGVQGSPKPINTVITVQDTDSTTLASATVTITNYVSGEDKLTFVAVPSTMGNISGSFDASKGVMTLTSTGATATVKQFETALRAVSYSNSKLNPNSTKRLVDYQVNDGQLLSNTITSTVTLGYYLVNAAYNSGSKTLTLTDDAADNAIAISLRAGRITIQGTGGTKIILSVDEGAPAPAAQLVSFPYKTDLKIVGTFTDGADTITMTGVKSSDTNLQLGKGADTVTLNYCNIAKLTVDGGQNDGAVDKLVLVGTIVAKKFVTFVP